MSNLLKAARVTEYEFPGGSTLELDYLGAWEAFDVHGILVKNDTGTEVARSYATAEQAAQALADLGQGPAAKGNELQ